MTPSDAAPSPDLAVAEWQAAHERVCALVEQAGDEAMATLVPATPAWCARDLLSHVVGLAHDVLAGDEPDDHDPAWTQAHVDARADRTTAELVAEWRRDAPAMLRYLREVDVRPLHDLEIHEQDLRGALGVPGGRDSAGLAAVRDVMAARLAAALDPDLQPVRLEADDPAGARSHGWSWTSGDGEPGVVLRASSYDLTRALTSRRTADQLRSWVVAGSVEDHLDALAQLGPLPDRPLPE